MTSRHWSLISSGLAVALALGGRPSKAFCETALRCGTHLVVLGATQEEVLSSCGSPTTTNTTLVNLRGNKGPAVRFVRTTWIYDSGPYQFTKQFVFADGVLQSMALGDYGR
jgi:hypothetical protein